MNSLIMLTIPGFPDIYRACSDGRIIRLSTSYQTSFRGKPVERPQKEKTLAGCKLSSKGYARVNICKQVHFVHRLIAMAFLSNPDNLPQVNHKNGIKTDNRPENLEWVSNLDNRRHAVENGLHAIGSAVSNRLVDSDVIKIRTLLDAGVCQRKVADAFGIVQQTVSHIKRRSTWRHI